MKPAMLLIFLLLFAACKKTSVVKKVVVPPPGNSAFNVTVIDRLNDFAELKWVGPVAINKNDSVTYSVMLGTDTLVSNLPALSYDLVNLNTTAYHGKLIAKSSTGSLVIDTFYVAPFNASYYGYSTTGQNFSNITIGFYAQSLWSFYSISTTSTIGMPFTTPVINADTLFCGFPDGMKAVNLNTGSEIWKIPLNGNPALSLLYHSGTIYTTLDYPQQLIAINSNNHIIKWTFTPFSPNNYNISDPVIANNTIYFSCYESIFAVDAATGIKKWEFTPNTPTDRPTTDGSSVYFGAQDNYLYSINANTGTVNWKHGLGSTVYFTDNTLVHNGVVIQCLSDKTVAIDSKSGSLLWQTPMSGLPGFKGDTVFLGYTNKVHALNIKTGSQFWVSALTDTYATSNQIIVVDSTIYTGEYNIHFNRIKAKTGASYFITNTSTSPGIMDFLVFPIINFNGKIYYGGSGSMNR
jgi:outer membrane protein assembly factor BamB